MVMVAAPMASGLTESGMKLAAAPVVPQRRDATTRAHAPDVGRAVLVVMSRGYTQAGHRGCCYRRSEHLTGIPPRAPGL